MKKARFCYDSLKPIQSERNLAYVSQEAFDSEAESGATHQFTRSLPDDLIFSILKLPGKTKWLPKQFGGQRPDGSGLIVIGLLGHVTA